MTTPLGTLAADFAALAAARLRARLCMFSTAWMACDVRASASWSCARAAVSAGGVKEPGVAERLGLPVYPPRSRSPATAVAIINPAARQRMPPLNRVPSHAPGAGVILLGTDIAVGRRCEADQLGAHRAASPWIASTPG